MTTAAETSTTTSKLSLPALTAMVVGSMVGAGVFQLPARFASQTGVSGALIAWAIAGLGMLTLALVFQTLAVRKPKLDNGVYVYAREGFGLYPGFLSAIGFWASACAGNAFYWVLIMTTLSQLFPDLEPLLGQGDTWPAFFLPKAELAALPQPSVGGVLEAAVGPWGGAFIRVGLIISVLGAYLAWQLLAADVVYAAARDNDLPRHFAVLNGREVPEHAVLWTSIFVTAILFAVQFVRNALDFTLDLTAALALAPYALASAYAVKIALRRDGYGDVQPARRTRELVIASISTIYTLFLMWAAGYVFLFLACILLAPATVLYILARRQQGARVFTRPGLVNFIVVLAFAVVGVVLLATGVVQV
ncbi:amino acid permease [Agromyces sp. NPDC055661]